MHLTFQEFFAAAGLHTKERFEEEAFAHLFEPRWEEVLRLGVGYMALVQKRPEATRRFVQEVLDYEAPEPERWITSVLKKQVPIATLLAAEAGDALPALLKRRVVDAFVAWVVAPPSAERAGACLSELSSMELSAPIEEALGRRLRDGSPEVRRGAARGLGWLGVVETTGELVALLEDADASVRDAAVWALWRSSPEDLPERLEGALKDGRPEVRAAAFQVLINIAADPGTVLGRAMSDADPLVRQAVLGEIGRPNLPNWLREATDLAPWLLAALRDEAPEVRKTAASLFNQITIDSVEIQEALLHLAESDPDPRVRAAVPLARVESERAVHAMLAVLVDPAIDWEDRLIVAGDLAKHPMRALAERRVAELLESGEAQERIGAIGFLEEIAPEAASVWAVAALVRLMMADPSSDVRADAMLSFRDVLLALGRRANEAAHGELPSPDPTGARRDAMEMWHSFIQGFLEPASRDASPQVRAAAVGVLALCPEALSLPVLARAAEDVDPEVRQAALWGLTERDPQRALPVLLRAVGDGDPDVGEFALWMLSRLRSAAAVPVLLDVLPRLPAAREALWKIAERAHHAEPSAAP